MNKKSQIVNREMRISATSPWSLPGQKDILFEKKKKKTVFGTAVIFALLRYWN